MALQILTDEGNMAWTCACGSAQTAHISHEEVQAHPNGHVVRLPVCGCGRVTVLKTHFTPEELAAPNMIDEAGQPTASHAVAHRHLQLIEKLTAKGAE